ncbi:MULTISPECIES: hypothetical protein [Psychrilyobacter]|nr:MULTISPECIES: hypothetical protein [Psychrilyobacter]MCS5420653.1 hypothetical protein [Psychrilyobacter sp. S5]NDI77827.1 hypothetical protein [Psychrilyobacter piezotolerans]
MKIKMITALTFIILLSACGGIKKTSETDLKISGLKGRVKSVKYSTYDTELKFGEIKKGTRSSSGQDNRYYYFNEKEVKIEEGERDSYDRIQRKTLYKYNDEGKLIQTSDFDSRVEFAGKTIYTRDDKGNLIEASDFNSKGEFIGKIIYTRDSKGNAVETNSYNSMGSLNSKFKFEYDKKGRVLESIYYGSDGELRDKTYFKYDGKGRVIEVKLITEDSIFIKNFKYENKEKDDVTLMIQYEGYLTMSKTRYMYKYDENGNWIQKISIEDEKPKVIEEREIEYYM